MRNVRDPKYEREGDRGSMIVTFAYPKNSFLYQF